MDWRVFLTTFITIFLAELGDKTQFAALTASAQSTSTVSVLLGVIVALSLAGAIGVIAGKFLGNMINPMYLQTVAGFMFISLGLWVLYGVYAR